MHRSVSILAVAVLGCATAPAPAPAPRPIAASVDPAEYAQFMQPGQHSVQGQAFLVQRGGDVVRGAGREVTLDPLTPYAMEWFVRFGADARRFDHMPPAPEFAKARRTTVADADGKFSFQDLPAGAYLVRSTVTWETGYSRQGGVVADTVTVGAAPPRLLILNRVMTPELAVTLGVSLFREDQQITRPHRVVGTVKGRSCAVGLASGTPTEEGAYLELLVAAARLEADAVQLKGQCKRGTTWSCARAVECEGDAIAWVR